MRVEMSHHRHSTATDEADDDVVLRMKVCIILTPPVKADMIGKLKLVMCK